MNTKIVELESKIEEAKEVVNELETIDDGNDYSIMIKMYKDVIQHFEKELESIKINAEFINKR